MSGRKRCRKHQKNTEMVIDVHQIIIKQRAGIKPSKVHQDKSKYNRARDKSRARREDA